MGAYSVIQYHQSTTLFSGDETAIVVAYLQGAYNAARWAEITVIVLMVLGVLAFTFLAYKLYLEFGYVSVRPCSDGLCKLISTLLSNSWHIYKKIGADLSMRGKDLLTFDLFHIPGILICVVLQTVTRCIRFSS
jgi:hypothetical protein